MIRLPENRGVSWLVGPSLALILSNIAPVQGSDYGSTGLIDIPSARMQADATLTATAAFDESADSYSLTYQATPWLEAASDIPVALMCKLRGHDIGIGTMVLKCACLRKMKRFLN